MADFVLLVSQQWMAIRHHQDLNLPSLDDGADYFVIPEVVRLR